MHRVKSVLSACFMVFLLISCSENKNASVDNTTSNTNSEEKSESPSVPTGNSDELLIGSWLVVDVVGEHKDLNLGLVYTWTKEGMMSMQKEFLIQGEYTVKDGVIVWKTKDFEFTYDFTISGDMMTLIPRESGHTYTLKRR